LIYITRECMCGYFILSIDRLLLSSNNSLAPLARVAARHQRDIRRPGLSLDKIFTPKFSPLLGINILHASHKQKHPERNERKGTQRKSRQSHLVIPCYSGKTYESNFEMDAAARTGKRAVRSGKLHLRVAHELRTICS